MGATCSYCGSGVGGPGEGGKSYCGFCQMNVTPAVDGQRLERFKPEMFIGYDQMHMTTPQLMDMHTKSLLELLRFMREERRSYFNNMRVLKKGATVDTQFKDVAKEAGDMYETITKKTYVVENILRERLGYIPEKISDAMLLKFDQLCQNPKNDKPMLIKRPEPEKELGRQREGVTR